MRRPSRLRRPALLAIAATLLAGLGAGAPGTAAPARAASAILPGAVDGTSLDVEARYDVRMTLRLASGTISVVEVITITNRSGGPIDHLELNTVLARIGTLRITAASVDGAAVRPVVTDQTIRLPLGGILPPDASATVRLAFGARFGTRLDASHWLFTSYGGAWAAYRWLPWVSRARRFDRANHGDPFITASSPFVRLTVTSDRAVTIATSGRRVAVNGRTQVFEATDVRDFTFVADPGLRATAATVGDTRVVAYARSAGRRAALLRETSRALVRLEQLLGPYPWRVLTVAETAGGYAVESPGAIWIPRGAASGRLPWLVSHEIAHQWFYGLVGSDQANEPFADEAPADYLARYVTGSLRSSRCAQDELDRSIYAYTTSCYFETVYVQGSQVLETIRKRTGTGAFFGAMQAYLAEHRNGIGSTRELLAAFDAVDPVDLAARLRLRARRFSSARPSGGPRPTTPRGRRSRPGRA
jgi:hypothetical protein